MGFIGCVSKRITIRTARSFSHSPLRSKALGKSPLSSSIFSVSSGLRKRHLHGSVYYNTPANVEHYIPKTVGGKIFKRIVPVHTTIKFIFLSTMLWFTISQVHNNFLDTFLFLFNRCVQVNMLYNLSNRCFATDAVNKSINWPSIIIFLGGKVLKIALSGTSFLYQQGNQWI